MTIKDFMQQFDDEEFFVKYGGGAVCGSANAVEFILGDVVNDSKNVFHAKVDNGFVHIVVEKKEEK